MQLVLVQKAVVWIFLNKRCKIAHLLTPIIYKNLKGGRTMKCDKMYIDYKY